MRMFFQKQDLDNLSDEELMRLVGKGHEAAFTTLYHRYSGKLTGFLIRMLHGDGERAKDILQDIFMAVMEHPGRFDAGRKFSSWIYTVAANRCRNEYRNTGVRRGILRALGETEASHTSPAYANRDMQLFRRQLDACLDALDEDTRLLFLLRFREELPVREIAQVLEVPEGTVKSRLFYLLRDLSKKLRLYHPIK